MHTSSRNEVLEAESPDLVRSHNPPPRRSKPAAACRRRSKVGRSTPARVTRRSRCRDGRSRGGRRAERRAHREGAAAEQGHPEPAGRAPRRLAGRHLAAVVGHQVVRTSPERRYNQCMRAYMYRYTTPPASLPARIAAKPCPLSLLGGRAPAWHPAVSLVTLSVTLCPWRAPRARVLCISLEPAPPDPAGARDVEPCKCTLYSRF